MMQSILRSISLVSVLAVLLVPAAISRAEPAEQYEDCSNLEVQPFPSQGGAPGDFWGQFSRPLPPTPAWNPPGTKHVGIQAGHWKVEEAPYELRRLSAGTYGGGKNEWEVNLDVAERTASILRDYGLEVDVLPVTLPERYRAHAFVALHADGDTSGALSGFKVARPIFSAAPETDDRLVSSLNDAYGATTGLARDDDHISRRMTGYYSFNSRRYCLAVAPGVPSAIVEMGFLTNASDRGLLIGNPDLLARGIADGVLRFLGLI